MWFALDLLIHTDCSFLVLHFLLNIVSYAKSRHWNAGLFQIGDYNKVKLPSNITIFSINIITVMFDYSRLISEPTLEKPEPNQISYNVQHKIDDITQRTNISTSWVFLKV